jgi:hypothetical protein
MRHQLRSLLVTGLGKVNFEANPHGGPFLAVASVQIIRGVDKLCGWKSKFRSPLPPLLERLELLVPDATQRHHSRERFQPVRCTGSIQGRKFGPSIPADLIGVLLALFFLFW